MTQYTHYSPGEFRGKRVVVTGGTEGQGKAIVQRLLLGGARVLTTARRPEGAAHLPPAAHFVPADLSTAEGCRTVIHKVLSHLGGVDF